MGLTAVSNKDGRITIPAEVRSALHIEGETHWTVEVADGAVILRPAMVVPRDDAWAYTPEHAAMVERAHEDARTGREIAVSGAELSGIADLPDDEMAAEIGRLRDAAARGERRT